MAWMSRYASNPRSSCLETNEARGPGFVAFPFPCWTKAGRIGTASRFTCVSRSINVSCLDTGGGSGVRRLTGDPAPPVVMDMA